MRGLLMEQNLPFLFTYYTHSMCVRKHMYLLTPYKIVCFMLQVAAPQESDCVRIECDKLTFSVNKSWFSLS